MKSWKTTLIALFGVLVAIMNQLTAIWDNNPATVADWQSIFPAVVALVGLFFAKDHSNENPEAGKIQRKQVYPTERARV